MKKMNNKKDNVKTVKMILLSIVTIIFLGGLLFLTFKELLTEKDITVNSENLATDSDKFEKEYESLNDIVIDNKKYLFVNIKNPNPMKYINTNGIVEKMDNKETFIIYFGYAKCPWCRSIVSNMINSSEKFNIDNIYYLDIENIRDLYTLNDNKELVLEKEGTEDYKVLLNKFDSVLDIYESFKYTDSRGKEIVVPVNEKRIYGPSIILVKEGVPSMMVSGIPDSMDDPYQNLSDEMLEESNNIFADLFTEYNNSGSNTCEKDKC